MRSGFSEKSGSRQSLRGATAVRPLCPPAKLHWGSSTVRPSLAKNVNVRCVFASHQHLLCLKTDLELCVFQHKLFVEPRNHRKSADTLMFSVDKLVCVPQLSCEPSRLPLFLLQPHQTCCKMCSRGRSRSRSRSAERAKFLADRFAAQKSIFLREHDNKDAPVQRRRCFYPQCSRVWTTAPYGVWVHVSCTATECISYLHEETARIQTELRSLDSEESIRSLKCSGQ